MSKNNLLFIGMICGDQCVLNYYTCNCGKDSFEGSWYSEHYCCTNSTCQIDNYGNVKCPQGQKLHITEKCEEQCPYRSKFIAISSSNCEKEESGCLEDSNFSKVCRSEDDFDSLGINTFCWDSDSVVSCLPNYNSAYSYRQCHTTSFHNIR